MEKVKAPKTAQDERENAEGGKGATTDIALAGEANGATRRDAGTALATHQQANSVEALIAKAIEHNVTAETMEKFFAMRRELKNEAAKEAFDYAMADFQAEMPTIEKKKKVKDSRGTLLYKYAQIESIVEQVRPLLKKNGFSFTFNVAQDKESVTVSCVVTHAAGHSQSSQFQVPSTGGTGIMSGPQKFAAALTFAKRYAFCDALGIMTGDEDTDAPKTKEDDLATDEQKADIDTLAIEAGYTKADVVAKFKERYKASYPTMTKIQAEGVIVGLKATVAKADKKSP